jgi:hypothetical protein
MPLPEEDAMDDSELRDEIQALLQRLGPLAPNAILQAIDDPQVELGDVIEAVTEAPEDPAAFYAFPLRDGRYCDLDHLIDGMILTHRLTDEERQTQELAVAPDLGLVMLVSPDGQTFPLTDGGEATYLGGADHRLAGPAGWLPDTPALELTIDDGRIVLTGRDDVPDVDETVADRLDEVLAEADVDGHALDSVELLYEARARYPLLLSTPQAPIGDLLADLGLHLTHRGIVERDDGPFADGHDDTFFDDEPFDDEGPIASLADHLSDDHGFDDEEVETFLGLYRTVLEVTNTVLRASLARLSVALGRDGVDEEDLLGLEVPDDPEDAVAFDEVVEAALARADLDTARGHLGALLDDQDLVDAILEDIVGTDTIAAGCVLALADHLAPDLRDRQARATVAWLRARCLELVADDHVDVERALRTTVELDPDNAQAAFELASYLSLRGEAGASLNLLRRIEGPDVEEKIALLSRFTTPGPASAGRNDPCPCGSGRKHKVCCQARNGWPLQERIPWVWDKVLTYLGSASAHELVSPIVQAIDDAGGPEGTGHLAATNITLFEGGLISELCDRRGSLLPADELELLRSWAEVRAAAYELVDADPDDRLTLLDLSTGDRVSFVDHQMAANLDVGAAFVAWIVPYPDGPAPNYGVISQPAGHRQGLLDLLDQDPTAGDLIAWYRSLMAPPRLSTTAGDPMEAITKVYAVPDVEAARTALTPPLEEDEGEADRLIAFEERDGQRWLRGSVVLDDPPGHLTVSTTSAVRAAWFADLVDAEVEGAELVDEERVPADDPSRLFRDGPFGEGGDPGEGVPSGTLDLDAMDPADRAALEEQLGAFMREHEDRWLDEEIPALGGVTPRNAAEDPTRRADLEELLREMEGLAEGWSGPGRPMDAGRLRRLLGM